MIPYQNHDFANPLPEHASSTFLYTRDLFIESWLRIYVFLFGGWFFFMHKYMCSQILLHKIMHAYSFILSLIISTIMSLYLLRILKNLEWWSHLRFYLMSRRYWCRLSLDRFFQVRRTSPTREVVTKVYLWLVTICIYQDIYIYIF